MRYRTRAHPSAADDASRLEPLRARWNQLPHWVQVGLVPTVLAVLALPLPVLRRAASRAPSPPSGRW